jgi:hypothetical protein
MSRLLFTIFLLCVTLWDVYAQVPAKFKRTSFGFSVGANTVMGMEASKLGLTLGTDAYYYPTRHLGLSFKPGVSLYNFRATGNPDWSGALEWELPLHGVLRLGAGAVRPVLEAGPNYKIDLLGSNKPMVGWDVSVGVELSHAITYRIKQDVYKMSVLPELRYSHSHEFGAVYFTLHFLK